MGVLILPALLGSFGAAELQADLSRLWLLHVMLGFYLRESGPHRTRRAAFSFSTTQEQF
jgi:hypothetical protein